MQEGFMLTTARKNIVYKLVEGAQLNPADFEWQGKRSRYGSASYGSARPFVSVLVHKPTGYFFMFDHSSTTHQFVSIVSPGVNHREEVSAASDWDIQMHDVLQWLDRLRSEIQEPDLWQMLSKLSRQPHRRLAGNVAISVFTTEEQEAVHRQMADVEKSIADLRTLSEQQFHNLHEKLNEITDATKELKRGHWYHFAIGEVVQFGLDAGLKSDAFGKIFQILQSAFHHLVNMPPILPPPSA